MGMGLALPSSDFGGGLAMLWSLTGDFLSSSFCTTSILSKVAFKGMGDGGLLPVEFELSAGDREGNRVLILNLLSGEN